MVLRIICITSFYGPGPDVDVRDLRDYWKKGQEDIQQRHYNTSWYNNPYFQAYEFLQGYYRDNVFGQLKLDYNVLPGLDLTLRTGFNQYSLNRDWKTQKAICDMTSSQKVIFNSERKRIKH